MIVVTIVIVVLSELIFVLVNENRKLVKQIESLYYVGKRVPMLDEKNDPLATANETNGWVRDAVFKARQTVTKYKGSVYDEQVVDRITLCQLQSLFALDYCQGAIRLAVQIDWQVP